MELWQQRCHAVEAGVAVSVFEEEDAFVGRLASHQRVLVFLDRTDDEIDSRVLRFEPGEFARPIVVREQGFRAPLEILPKRGVVGRLGGLAKRRRGMFDMACERFVIGDGDEPA